MKFKFILKDKGTINQGWWLQLSNIDELIAYMEATQIRYGNVLENYIQGKEYNPSSNTHQPHMKEADLTNYIYLRACKNHTRFYHEMITTRNEIAINQMHDIQKYGSIFVNENGGYHRFSEHDKCYDVVYRDNLLFPKFKKTDIRVKKFPYGQHYYAYVGDLQVKDGDSLKWNTYEEAYEQACKMLK